jgi:integrase
MIEEKIVRQESNEVSQKTIPQQSNLPPQSIKTRNRIYPVTEGLQSIKTQESYEKCFKQFLNYIKICDKQVLLDFSPKVIKQMIIDYIIWSRDEKPGKKLSRASIKVHLAAILRFFQINNDDFNLTTRNFRLHMPSNELIKDDRPYTTDEIRQVIEECDLRSKAIILILCSTGMRKGALHSMRIGHLTEMKFKESLKIYRVEIYAGSRDHYFSFCTPECYSAINKYLDDRRHVERNWIQSRH